MNIEKICRCCLSLDMPLLSIYDGESAGKGCVADMLKQIANLVPQPADNMPDKACLQCISEINRCYVFKMKCENSNRTLRQLLPDAVPEPFEIISKKVLVVSAAVQTEDDTLTSSQESTINEELPIGNQNDVQTDENEMTPTENNIQPDERKFEENNEHIENIVTCEKNHDEKTKKRVQFSAECEQDRKKLRLESGEMNNLLTTSESELASQCNEYILLEDSNFSEETEVYISNPIENRKDPECEHYEYYENEPEPQDGYKEHSEHQNNCSNENLKTNNNVNENSLDNTKPNKEGEETKSMNSAIGTRALSRPKGQYKCSHCIMTFVSMKVLKRHLANRHGIKDDDLIIDYVPATEPYEMIVDGPSFGNKACLYNTNMELTPENVPKPHLMPRRNHTCTKSDMLNVKYFCDFCHAGFAHHKTLTYHMKHRSCMTHNFKCNICGSIFVSEENLKAHKRTHENPHKCLECDTVCKTIEELSQHMIQEHNRNARNQCHICKKVFTMKTSLIDHLRIHSGEKPFLCTICGKKFRQNSNLRQHLIRHTNEKNFKCDMCANAYVTKAELFSHKRTHTGDHPFKCNDCQSCFTTSCSLKKHIRKHTGERPYACEFCPMRFASLNVLKNHHRIHTGEKPFKCAHCQKSFTQKGDCLIHERTHINNEFQCFCASKSTKKPNPKSHVKTQHIDFIEKDFQSLLDKSAGDNDNAEYNITLIEDANKSFISSRAAENENYSDCSLTMSEEKLSSKNNEELLEIVMEDVG